MNTKILLDINSNVVRTIGWLASFAAIMMYISYIDQIHLNLNGQKGSSLQALATVLNCSLWIAYGMVKTQRDWPIIAANLPGIFLGFMAFSTSL
ncbi:SemiSWEET family transporter [Zhongshania sp. BJYM1]|uniref:SemiSWEET family transporter n=1 Tax=Zhongshania aquatica TaxID=2965069 RepID=UPI0022B50D57|nr:SemiSWEET family transporter [Marortus sp. BJYM1]